MNTQSSAPVPQSLREILRDYPELIQEIQDALDRIVVSPRHGTPIIDQTIWMLEDVLGEFTLRAAKELKEAQGTFDPSAIARAEAKQASVVKARPKRAWLLDLDEFEAYARTHRTGGPA